MKTGILTTKTIASDDIKDNKSIMGMSSKGMEMAQYFLRDKIYSDKVLAVVREYISNAQDEHVKHGITKDVEVSLKGVNNQWVWSVRDYAKGLDDHGIRNIFGVYFESTKSQTNDSIGGFGIGSKAGFSYSDTFYVTSYYNGVKTSYICTLGSGDKGIPVGEIYEISQEPTSEQGIEISLEVKGSDVYDFSNKTETLISYFIPNTNIVFNDEYSKRVTRPIIPTTSKSLGGYVFNNYTTRPYYNDGTFFVRMGGILYPYTTPTRKKRFFSNTVIVDVPIGKLSIPISRESIENTPLNDKVFQDIENVFDKIAEQEIATLQVAKFGNLVSGNDPFARSFNGEWFVHSFKECFPSTSKHYYNVGRKYKTHNDYHNSPVYVNDTKYMVYIMPNIKSLNNWHKRLINALIQVKGTDYDGYLYITKDKYDDLINNLDDKIDVSDCVFVDIKTLKLPKLETIASSDIEKYLVYEKYGYKHYYTATELDANVINDSFNDKDLEDDWYLEANSMEVIHSRTIGNTKDYGTRSNFYTANSKKMIENLKELGWLTPECDEYKEIKKKFDEEYSRKQAISNAEYSLERMYYGIKPTVRLSNIIKSDPDKIDRLRIVKDKITSEDSTRGRILRSISDYNRKFNRQDLRKILLMKD